LCPHLTLTLCDWHGSFITMNVGHVNYYDFPYVDFVQLIAAQVQMRNWDQDQSEDVDAFESFMEDLLQNEVARRQLRTSVQIVCDPKATVH
jgi:hypothetical protein